ncbi:MAG: GNAT family N-acetyltransferase [Flavipsychrobacter sp.]
MEHIAVVEVAFDSDIYKQVYFLRNEVLRKPIGLSLDDEDLSAEVNDHILAAVDKEEVIGCLILTPINKNTLQLRQMAVADQWQKKGLGSLLVKKAEQLTIEKGYSKILLHARIVARNFYQKLGYSEVGTLFTEVGIDHIKMEKSIIETV